MEIKTLTIRQLVWLGGFEQRWVLTQCGYREGSANNAAGTLFILSDTRSYTRFMQRQPTDFFGRKRKERQRKTRWPV